MNLKITPLRLSVLRFLAQRPSYSIKGLVHDLCPRNTSTGAWTEQGAARMAGKLIKPLREAGLVKDDPLAPMYRRSASITDAGRALLAEHDAAAARAELVQAPQSAA